MPATVTEFLERARQGAGATMLVYSACRFKCLLQLVKDR